MGETLADLGEWELIRRLGAFAPPGQFSDDAALLPLTNGTLVLTTDVLVEGIHFSDITTEPGDVGWRAAAANLSDLAAMGCQQGMGITVGLVAPTNTPWSWVEGVYRGIDEALRRHGGVVLGGDCSGGSQRLLAITALGLLRGEEGPIRRSDGLPGDLLVCTGPHGLSRLGLALLQSDPRRDRNDAGTTEAGGLAGLDPALMQRAIQAHRRPVPRFDAVRALGGCRPAGHSWRVGGCDSSDGLAAAVATIAAASGCAARLERQQLPLDPAMASLPQAQAWCLGGGEDFELVLALEPRWAEALVSALPGATRIGELLAGAPGVLGWADGTPWDAAEGASRGYCHFSGEEHPP
jgi:thiamine-monophosphate kinase